MTRIFVILTVIMGAALYGAQAAYSGSLPRLNTSEPILEFGDSNDRMLFQVRVRQRVIIRIPRAPRTTKASYPVSARKDQKPVLRIEEKKIGQCLWVSKLAGTRPGRSKEQNLEIFTRDGQMIRAYLGKGCKAQEFYAGAYMEKAKDGKICADRDILHARNGAKCEIDKFRLLVAKR